MNLSFLVKKNHIFKRRKLYKTVLYKKIKFYSGIYTINKLRFELIYLKVIKKLFRKKYFKKDIMYKTKKFWVMIKPNLLLTMKSKNARMGSGVGNYVRVASCVKPNTPIILVRRYQSKFIINCIKYLKLKLNINLYFNRLQYQKL